MNVIAFPTQEIRTLKDENFKLQIERDVLKSRVQALLVDLDNLRNVLSGVCNAN